MCITKNGVVRGKSWTRQTLSDAWESTNWEGLCGTPWQMVAPELKLTKRAASVKEGAETQLPWIVLDMIPQVEPRRLYVLSADIETHAHTGGCPSCAALESHGRATKPHNNECRERIRTVMVNFDGESKDECMQSAFKDRVAETERVKEAEELKWKEVQEICLFNPGTRSRWRIYMRSHQART